MSDQESGIRFDRLLNVVRALEEANDPEPGKPGFDMMTYVHPCGTPGCALGHYAARTDLQAEFRIVHSSLMFGFSHLPISDGYVHFGFDSIGTDYMDELFSMAGCGGAQTRQEAADYIRDFIRRHGGAA